MTPKWIILLRHGQSAANADQAVYAQVPDYRIALTDEGISQSRAAGARIAQLIGDEPFGVFCSPYRRTVQTKDAMLEGLGRSPAFDYQDPSLREQEYGNMPQTETILRHQETRHEFGRFFYRFPEGESCADVYDRMTLFLHSLYRFFERTECPANIVIVSHGTAIKCFLARWYHWSVERFDDIGALPNCHVSVMTKEQAPDADRKGVFTLDEPFCSNPVFADQRGRL